MICVLARIRLQPGTRDAFLEIFRKIIPQVRAEKGCLEYAPWESFSTTIPSQVGDDPDTIYVLEKWESLSDLEAHLVAPHMVEYRREVRPYVQEVGLYILKPVPLP